jgi:23S rRNA (uridine2552-2'-O)-methyltransferase
MKVLDLGAAPGSWSQYAAQKVGKTGRILGIDIQPIKITLPNALFLAADMRDLDLGKTMAEQGIEPPFDVVLSDMAPKTTGYRLQDQMRSLELCELALATCERFLRKDGTFVCKLFHSDEFENFRNLLRQRFAKIDLIKPESTRKGSKEIFFIARGFKGAPTG